MKRKIDKTFLNIYQNKKVLVTGHTGFVGGWLCLWLKRLGAKVVGYSLSPTSKPNIFESISLNNTIENHCIGDIREFEQVLKYFEEQQPEIVFHLAAQPLVRLSYDDPILTYSTNVLGTVNILEALRKTTSVRSAVIVTSDKCYENQEWLFGYRETDPMGGHDPYSSSKGCSELVTWAYQKSFFNPSDYEINHQVCISSVRAGNIIGGGDWGKDRLIPDMVKAFSNNKSLLIRHPKAIRPWQFVLEPLSGYLWIGALMHRFGCKYSQAWNLGPDSADSITVEQIVNAFQEEWGGGEYGVVEETEYHEANWLKLDTNKAYSLLKWRPLYNTLQALRETAKWYKNFYSESPEDVLNFTLAQIDAYLCKARRIGVKWVKEDK